jgi:integrase
MTLADVELAFPTSIIFAVNANSSSAERPGVFGLGADYCTAETSGRPEDREADIRPNRVESARWRGADAWCGRAGWRPHHVQYPASSNRPQRPPWNKGRLIGQKRPLLPRQVWAIRARLELADNLRDLALFNLAIDSKLRGCDLVRLKVVDLVAGGNVRDRVSVIQSKTGRPVQFEVSENTRRSVLAWVTSAPMLGQVYLFPSRFHSSPHISTRQYARLVHDWVSAIGLDPSGYGTHSLRRTKAALIYRKTGNLRAVQLLLGHTKVDSTVRYLGVELDDALSIAEKDRHLNIWRTAAVVRHL